MEGQDIAVPSVFIIGKDGRIHYRHIGESVSDRPSPSDIIDAIKKIEGT
jgi:peroxiredoxin